MTQWESRPQGATGQIFRTHESTEVAHQHHTEGIAMVVDILYTFDKKNNLKEQFFLDYNYNPNIKICQARLSFAESEILAGQAPAPCPASSSGSNSRNCSCSFLKISSHSLSS